MSSLARGTFYEIKIQYAAQVVLNRFLTILFEKREADVERNVSWFAPEHDATPLIYRFGTSGIYVSSDYGNYGCYRVIR